MEHGPGMEAPVVASDDARGGVLRASTAQLAFGIFHIVFGTQLVLSPAPFDVEALRALPATPLAWASALLLSGFGLVVVATLPPIRGIDAGVHVFAALVRLAVGRAYLPGPASVLGVAFVAGAVALLAIPALRSRRSRVHSRDLYGLTMGATALVGGLLLALQPAPFAPPRNGWFQLYTSALALTGLSLLACHVAPQRFRRARIPIHLVAGAVFVAFVPVQAGFSDSSATAWFAWHGLLLAALPWLSPRLEDPRRSAQARVPVVMAALTGAPAIVCLALVTAHRGGSMTAGAAHEAIWFLLLVVLPATAAAAILSSRWLADPLRSLAAAAREVGTGKPASDLPSSRLREVTGLSSEFVAMRRRLEEREAELRRNQRQLNAILEHLPAAVYLKDLEGRYVLASRRATELKAGGGVLLGKTDAEIFPAPVAAAIADHDRKVLQAGQPLEFDEEIPTAAGPTTQLSIKFPILDERGALSGIGGISTDITERKWLEQVQEEERRALERTARGEPFETVLSGLVAAVERIGGELLASILVLDGAGQHLRNGASSPRLPAAVVAATERFPVGPSSASCGTSIWRREPVVVRDIATDPLWSDYRGLVLPHGLRACWSTPVLNARGEPLGTFAIYYREPREPPRAHLRIVAQLERTLSVILERQRAEIERARLLADLGAMSARYQSLFDGTAEAILVIGTDGGYLDANLAASQLTGYSQEELRKMRVGDLAPDRDRFRESWERIRREGRWGGEAELRRKDGMLVPVETRVASVSLSSGPVVVSTMRDISERRALERLRRDFIAVVGHELRNPLNSIMGSAQLMRASGKFNERAVDRIVRQTRQLERIITDLQEAHNIESGQLRLRPREVDLLPLLRSCVEEAAGMTGTHAVRMEAPEEPVAGVFDGDRICQVLRNLLSNAIKYSPMGGEVLVRVGANEQEVSVSVSDQGPGIARDALPRLFERFYRAPESAEAVPGMGIGLFVCRELIEGHGGALTVSSEVGRGSTFSFRLPRRGSVRRDTPVSREQAHAP